MTALLKELDQTCKCDQKNASQMTMIDEVYIYLHKNEKNVDKLNFKHL